MKMDQDMLDQGKGEMGSSHTAGCMKMDQDMLDQGKGEMGSSHTAGRLSQQGFEEKKSAVHSEMDRMSQLPPKSSYAVHRMRVLKKILHLMSIQRTMSQDEELELLFAGLSL